MGAEVWEVRSGKFEEVGSGGVRSPQMKMEWEGDIGQDDSNRSNL